MEQQAVFRCARFPCGPFLHRTTLIMIIIRVTLPPDGQSGVHTVGRCCGAGDGLTRTVVEGREESGEVDRLQALTDRWFRELRREGSGVLPPARRLHTPSGSLITVR